MKLILVMVILGISLTSLLVYAKNRTEKVISVDQMLDEEIKKYTRNIQQPSIAIGVYKDGKIFFKNVGESISEDSIFQIGSITKLLTASSFQCLVDEKKLSLDATIGDLISNSQFDKNVNSITLLELATHTSGLPSVPKPLLHYVLQRTRKENIYVNPYSYLNNELLLQYLENPIGLKNKKRFEYSNYGMGLLGYLLATKNNTSYEELVKQKILDPLEMTPVT